MKAELSLVVGRGSLYRSMSGPWIVTLHGAAPQTLEDVLYTKRIGKLDPHYHCVPRDRVYRLSLPTDYEVVPAATLYRDRSRTVGKPLKLTLREATEIYDAYWGGHIEQYKIAEARKLTTLTVFRLVHRLSYWFI